EEARQQREEDARDKEKATKDAERDAEKQAKEDERNRDREIRDAAQQQKDEVERQNRLEQHAADTAKDRLNPAGLTLQDYAKEGRGTVRSLAEQAQREEAAARREGLGGNIGAANLHQDRAEQLKKSLGLPN